MTSTDNALDLLAGLIAKARRYGADSADAVMFQSTELSVQWRLGKSEGLQRSEAQDLGLRVFVGRRQAIVSSTDLGDDTLDGLAERAVAMARVVPEDPHCGLADAALLQDGAPDLDLLDDAEPDAETLMARASAAEDAARAVEGVTNSEGAEASWGRAAVAMAASNGFAGTYASSRHGVAASVLAGEGTDMQRDYDYTSARHGGDLDDSEALGRRAGERAVARLNPRKAETARVPIVYAPRVASSLLRHLGGAISGASIARGTSFLKDRMGQPLFPAGITVSDDPHRRRGLGSKPFDGEGVAGRKRDIVAEGRLTTWLLDSRSARQLGLESTGHASRGVASPPSPSASNFYLAAGDVTPEGLIADIAKGLYVTELIGMGVNGITGDYSRGAAGFWIEDGVVTYPVSEVTIAGNLIDMYAHLAAADDLVFRYGVDAPTLRIDGMTVAGL